eukprot:2087739-Rhodomonas_salina.2
MDAPREEDTTSRSTANTPEEEAEQQQQQSEQAALKLTQTERSGLSKGEDEAAASSVARSQGLGSTIEAACEHVNSAMMASPLGSSGLLGALQSG